MTTTQPIGEPLDLAQALRRAADLARCGRTLADAIDFILLRAAIRQQTGWSLEELVFRLDQVQAGRPPAKG